MGWVTYQFSHAMRHNDANNMTPHHYHFLLWLPFPNFQINWCLSKNVSNVPDPKKGGLHLWTTTSFTYHCWLAFFSSFVKSWRKTTKLKKLFNWTADWSGELNTPRNTEYTNYFIISKCSNARDFMNWRIFWIQSTANSKCLYMSKYFFLIKCTLVIWQIQAYKTF